MKKTLLAIALMSSLSACYQQPQMAQVCGIDPNTGGQNCIMVPRNQMAQYQQQGYYGYSNGVYRDSGGHEVAAALVGAAAGYALSQHLNNRNTVQAPQQTYYNAPPGAYQTPNGRWKGANGQFIPTPTQSNAPTTFQATSAANTTTSKAPTGGQMAGQTDFKLTNNAPAAQPAFKPVAATAPSYAPSSAPVTPMFKPTATQPKVSLFKPSAASSKPVAAPAPRASFKPTSAKSK